MGLPAQAQLPCSLTGLARPSPCQAQAMLGKDVQTRGRAQAQHGQWPGKPGMTGPYNVQNFFFYYSPFMEDINPFSKPVDIIFMSFLYRPP